MPGQLFEEVGAGHLCLVGVDSDAVAVQELRRGTGQLRLQLGDGCGMSKGVAQTLEAGCAALPLHALIWVLEIGPKERRQSAGTGRETQQTGSGVERQQLFEDEGGVLIVEPSLVSLVVSLGGKLAHQRQQSALLVTVGALAIDALARRLAQSVEGQPGALFLRRRQDLGRQVLAAVDARRLRHHQLIPEGLRVLEARVIHRLVEVGAGEMEGHDGLVRLPPPASRRPSGHHRQVYRPRIDREAVATQLEDVVAALVDIAAVAQRARRLLARRLEARVQLVGLHRVADLAQIASQIADLRHHGVGDEIGVERVEIFQRRRAAPDAVEGCVGRPTSCGRRAADARLRGSASSTTAPRRRPRAWWPAGRGSRRTRRSDSPAPLVGAAASTAARRTSRACRPSPTRPTRSG